MVEALASPQSLYSLCMQGMIIRYWILSPIVSCHAKKRFNMEHKLFVQLSK